MKRGSEDIQWCQESSIRNQVVCTLNHLKWQKGRKSFLTMVSDQFEFVAHLVSLALILALWALCWRKPKDRIHWYYFRDNDHYVCTYSWRGKLVNVHFDMVYWDRAGDLMSMWALYIMYTCEHCIQCTIYIYTFGKKTFWLNLIRLLTFIFKAWYLWQ